jgi:hypothetical protein
MQDCNYRAGCAIDMKSNNQLHATLPICMQSWQMTAAMTSPRPGWSSSIQAQACGERMCRLCKNQTHTARCTGLPGQPTSPKRTLPANQPPTKTRKHTIQSTTPQPILQQAALFNNGIAVAARTQTKRPPACCHANSNRVHA